MHFSFARIRPLLFLLTLIISCQVLAQTETSNDLARGTSDSNQNSNALNIPEKGFFSGSEWYVSGGFHKSHYSNSDISVSQPSLGNNFTVNDVKGHDEFPPKLCCMPDNIRIGRFFDGSKKFGLELSLDHTKFTSTLGQTAFVSGVNNGSLGVGNQQLNANNFYYRLHNGLNHLMVNLVYRTPIFGEINEQSSLVFIGRVGTGLAYVHPDITISGNDNYVGKKSINNLIGFDSGWWRIVGMSTGTEIGVRYSIYKQFYIELTDKIVFSNLYNIPVYQGKASQNLFQNQVILSAGFTFGGTK